MTKIKLKWEHYGVWKPYGFATAMFNTAMILKHSHTHWLHIEYSWIPVLMPNLSSWNQNDQAHKNENIYYLSQEWTVWWILSSLNSCLSLCSSVFLAWTLSHRPSHSYVLTSRSLGRCSASFYYWMSCILTMSMPNTIWVLKVGSSHLA